MTMPTCVSWRVIWRVSLGSRSPQPPPPHMLRWWCPETSMLYAADAMTLLLLLLLRCHSFSHHQTSMHNTTFFLPLRKPTHPHPHPRNSILFRFFPLRGPSIPAPC